VVVLSSSCSVLAVMGGSTGVKSRLSLLRRLIGCRAKASLRLRLKSVHAGVTRVLNGPLVVEKQMVSVEKIVEKIGAKVTKAYGLLTDIEDLLTDLETELDEKTEDEDEKKEDNDDE